MTSIECVTCECEDSAETTPYSTRAKRVKSARGGGGRPNCNDVAASWDLDGERKVKPPLTGLTGPIY